MMNLSDRDHLKKCPGETFSVSMEVSLTIPEINISKSITNGRDRES